MNVFLNSLLRLNEKGLLTEQMIEKAINNKWITTEEAKTIELKVVS